MQKQRQRSRVAADLYFTASAEETVEVGAAIGATVRAWRMVRGASPRALATRLALKGPLGAGKTTLVKGIVSALTSVPEEEVQSPTFTYVHTYQGEIDLHHFDLYRLGDPSLFFELGLHDYFALPTICCVEWPERLDPSLLIGAIQIEIEPLTPDERRITLTWPT
jgi:tRNA threonylcarbamoyladenosine biosynthesis protein TsaE